MSDEGDSQPSTVEAVDGLEDAPLDPTGFLTTVESVDDDLLADARSLVEYAVELESAHVSAEEEIDELTSRLKRAHADFENYKKRIERRREDERTAATRRVIDRLLTVRADLARAVSAEEQTIDDLRDGVRLTLNELDRILDAEGVEEIAPDVGDEVDPRQHEVMLRVESDQPADHIAEVFESGYRHGDTVLREAQVSVSAGTELEE